MGASVLVLGAGTARAEGGLFVLPVERSWPVNASAAAVFEERVSIALAETKRARPLGTRDVPEEQRSALPKDLSACVTRACLERLARITRAERVLGTKLADDGGAPTLFATLYDARSGAILQRREWPGRPDELPVSAELASEVASWAVGPPPARAPAPAPPARMTVLAPVPGVVALGLAPGEHFSLETSCSSSNAKRRIGEPRARQRDDRRR